MKIGRHFNAGNGLPPPQHESYERVGLPHNPIPDHAYRRMHPCMFFDDNQNGSVDESTEWTLIGEADDDINNWGSQ